MHESERAVAGLAALAATPLPNGARHRMLDVALRRRPAGAHVGGPAPLAPVACLHRGYEELLARLGGLDDRGWAAPVPFYPGWRVHDLVTHLVGVERYWGGELGLWPQCVPDAVHDDHLACTAATQDELRDATPAAVLAELHGRADALVEHLDARGQDGLRARSRFHYLRGQALSELVLLRAFEVWIHGEDVAAACGEPLPGMDGGRAASLGRLAARAIPLGVALGGLGGADATVRMVLTGAGGGCVDVPLAWGAPVAQPSATVVVDVVDFCRLAARRLAPGALPVAVDGDRDLAEVALAGAAVFAV